LRKFIFDVDGTLTPSRQKMDAEFSNFFETFSKSYPVYLVTGSDKPKTIEQIGEKIFNLAQMSFNCAGNEVWIGKDLIYKNDWTPSSDLVEFLEDLLSKSSFEHKAGNHIEFRNGMINFSIVGRKCTYDQRQLYKLWDEETSERKTLADILRKEFTDIDINIGGETGLDIFKKGGGKSQSIQKIRTSQDDVLQYFGDQIFPGGNDYDAAVLCDHYVQITDWTETYERLIFIDELMK
jgi:phosphomannomutase